jgi:hypothetical protein
MSVHLHRTRQWTAWALIATAASPFALVFASTETSRVPLATVTGRVTMSGQPLNDDTIICLDSGGVHRAFGCLGSDGTFELTSMRRSVGGTEPGRYHGHLFSRAGGTAIPPQYGDPKTSGIDIDVAGDWNDFHIDLP